ncbi:MAG: hypothetical protein JSR44_14455 [Spirochaetes bacterium]|nr:hypothetical protein [Spirochaetota bacterium]
MRLKIFFLASFVTMATLGIDDAAAVNPTSTKAAFKRRVLLTIFANESKDTQRQFLAESVPAAFSNPLVKAGSFVVLHRPSIDQYLQRLGITARDIYEEQNAARLGRIVGADVVIVGKFVSSKDRVTITARAIDVESRRLSVEDSAVVQTNANMFDEIDRLAMRMSKPMADKLKPLETEPPPPETTLERVEAARAKAGDKEAGALPATTESKDRALKFTLRAGAAFGVWLGDGSGIYPVGFGGILGGEILGLSRFISQKEWLKKFEIGLFAGYLIYPAKNMAFTNLSQIPIHFALGYRFTFAALPRLALTPLVSAGMDFGSFSKNSSGIPYNIFAWSVGGRGEYILSDRWSVALASFLLVEQDQGFNAQWVNFLSVGWRW